MSRQHVLVVDDDTDMRTLLTDVLTSAGYRVTATESAFGTVALAQRLHPSVILLDLALPFRSGASLLADLKADPTTAQIPIVIVSAVPGALTTARRLMVSDIVAKPFDLATLLGAVRAACAAALH